MTTPSICVIVPVLNRPHRVKLLIESFVASQPMNALLFFIAQHGDTEEGKELSSIAGTTLIRGFDWISVPASRQSWSQKINEAYRRDESDWLLLGADDLHFHSGWDTAPLELMKNPNIGVIGTNDLGNPLTMDGSHSTHPFVRRSYVERFGIEEAAGIVVPECYHHNYPDTELIAIAKKRGAYAHCKESIVEHLHPLHGKGQDDDTYRLGQERFSDDRKLFFARASIYKWPLMGHPHPVGAEPKREVLQAPSVPTKADRVPETSKQRHKRLVQEKLARRRG